MFRNLVWLSVFLIFAALGAGSPALAGESVESFSIRDGGAFNVLVIDPGDTAIAVILFAGGKGIVNIPDDGRIGKNNNFLIRSRGRFAANDLITAVIDAPENLREGKGLRKGFRVSGDHAADVGAVIKRLRKRGANKVWLVGTSRGSISVAGTASHLGAAPKGPDGIVLTASVVTPGDDPDTTLDADLTRITVPALIVHHEKDACVVSPFADIDPMKDGLAKAREVEVITVTGGDSGKPKNWCSGKSNHGFWKIENRVVTDIADWIKVR